MVIEPEKEEECEAVVRRFVNASIDAALHHRNHHGSRGTLEELCVRLWEGALSEDMLTILRSMLGERGYGDEVTLPVPPDVGQPRYIKRGRIKRRLH